MSVGDEMRSSSSGPDSFGEIIPFIALNTPVRMTIAIKNNVRERGREYDDEGMNFRLPRGQTIGQVQ